MSTSQRIQLFGYSIPTRVSDPVPAYKLDTTSVDDPADPTDTTSVDLPITQDDLSLWPRTLSTLDLFTNMDIDLPVTWYEDLRECNTCEKFSRYMMRDESYTNREYCVACYVLFDYPK
jgi:hypothetical protein